MKNISPKLNKLFAIGLMGAGLVSLSACASFKKITGSEKVTPDEFRVVTKAPLVIPPEFNLRPPRPGEARPIELRPDMQARTAVFGVQTGLGASDGERYLIHKMGADNADPRIRDVVDEESGSISHKTTSFADKVLSFGKQKTETTNPLDAETEAQSIKNSTGGEKVIIQQNKPRAIKLPGL